jgi:hypothetical protein
MGWIIAAFTLAAAVMALTVSSRSS